jgi:hypothetical protein
MLFCFLDHTLVATRTIVDPRPDRPGTAGKLSSRYLIYSVVETSATVTCTGCGVVLSRAI